MQEGATIGRSRVTRREGSVIRIQKSGMPEGRCNPDRGTGPGHYVAETISEN